MIDFACKQFDLSEIIKCSLGLTRAEISLFYFFIEKNNSNFSTDELSHKLKLDLSTVQRGVKKLREKNIIVQSQHNLSTGGYYYYYKSNSKVKVREILKSIIKDWSKNVECAINKI